MTPFAAYITLKKTLQKGLDGTLATPAPPLLLLFQQAQEQNLYLQAENSRLKSAVDNLDRKCDEAVNNNKDLIKSIAETKHLVDDLSDKNSNLYNRIHETEKELARYKAEKTENEVNLKENKKKHNLELKKLQIQIKDLNNTIKLKEKEHHDLNKTLENARATIKTYKAEKSQLKVSKTRLETEVRKLEKSQHGKKRENSAKTIESKNRDENANIKTLDQISISDYSGSMIFPSMVSHHVPQAVKIFQRPASVTSMIAHCALSPPPGSSLLSMKEVMEELEKAVEKMFQSMNMKWCSTNPSS